jgi:hypothetical protein
MVVLTALSLGYEIGRAIKYVGGSIKNVDALFKEAKKMDAILVFDQASVLFSSSLPSSQVRARTRTRAEPPWLSTRRDSRPPNTEHTSTH